MTQSYLPGGLAALLLPFLESSACLESVFFAPCELGCGVVRATNSFLKSYRNVRKEFAQVFHIFIRSN
jgi:hypothetical protein